MGASPALPHYMLVSSLHSPFSSGMGPQSWMAEGRLPEGRKWEGKILGKKMLWGRMLEGEILGGWMLRWKMQGGGTTLGKRYWEEGCCDSVKSQADKKSECAGNRRQVKLLGLNAKGYKSVAIYEEVMAKV